MDLLGVMALSNVHGCLCWRGKTGIMPKNSLAWCHPIRPRFFTSTISINMTWCTSQNFLHTPLNGALQKCF